MPSPDVNVGVTSAVGSTSAAPARTASSRPKRRSNSMPRVLMTSAARGWTRPRAARRPARPARSGPRVDTGHEPARVRHRRRGRPPRRPLPRAHRRAVLGAPRRSAAPTPPHGSGQEGRGCDLLDEADVGIEGPAAHDDEAPVGHRVHHHLGDGGGGVAIEAAPIEMLLDRGQATGPHRARRVASSRGPGPELVGVADCPDVLDPVARDVEGEHRHGDAVLLGDQAGLAVDRALEERQAGCPAGDVGAGSGRSARRLRSGGARR